MKKLTSLLVVAVLALSFGTSVFAETAPANSDANPAQPAGNFWTWPWE